jgi:hypothetical protein
MSVSIKQKWVQSLTPFTSTTQLTSPTEVSPEILQSLSSPSGDPEELDQQPNGISHHPSNSFRHRSYLRSPSPSTQIYPEEIELTSFRSQSGISPTYETIENSPNLTEVSWRLAKPKER